MWEQLIWNFDFLRHFIFFALGVLAAIFLIPKILGRWQTANNKRIAKILLREWGGDCIGAIMRLKPFGTIVEIEGYNHFTESGGYGSDLPISKFWEDIKEGKKNPDGAAAVIDNAFQKALFSEEERAMKSSPPDNNYPFHEGDPEVPRAMIKRILNPMYAKLEIFDSELLPINELEMAMSDLDAFSQQGYYGRYGFISYALHLAQSMEKFASYLWKLEGWDKESQRGDEAPVGWVGVGSKTTKKQGVR